MNDKHPIIVFDSGFGGISVLKELIQVMPNEDFLYYGDSANAPYGPRPQSEVRDLTLEAIQSLEQYGPKAVVIACNTATAASLDALRQVFTIPVIGIRPAVQAAAAAGGERMLVLATAGTLGSASFHQQMEELKTDAEVITMAAPGIVTYVEGTMNDRTGILAYLKDLFRPLEGKRVDSVVLGCTHFPFAKDVIQEALGYPVTFFDASKDVARETEAELAKRGWKNAEEESGSLTFVNSAHKQQMLSFAWNLFSHMC
jgi:glutamate racemase